MYVYPAVYAEEPKNCTLFIDNFLCRKYYTLFIEQPVEVIQEPKYSTLFIDHILCQVFVCHICIKAL